MKAWISVVSRGLARIAAVEAEKSPRMNTKPNPGLASNKMGILAEEHERTANCY